MKKVAIINSVYETGSTGVLAQQLYEYGQKNGFDSFVFYGRGKRYSDNHLIRIDTKTEVLFHKILTLLTGYQGFFSNVATKRMISRIISEKIERVILLNLHGYYLNEKKLLSFLKDSNIDTVYVTPDEYAGLGKCCYSLDCEKYQTVCTKCPQKRNYPKSLFFDRSKAIFTMKEKVYSGFEKLCIVGPETNLIKFRQSSLLKNTPMRSASWGINLDLYKYEVDSTLYDKYGIPQNKVIILTVAQYSNTRKGVKEFFFELAKRKENSDYHFVNVGYDGDLDPKEIPQNMTTIPYISDQVELSHMYSIADLYLLASTADTMPLSCLISFACETPVCCFYTSGLKYLADRDNPAIHYCDDISIDSLEKSITKVTKKNKDEMLACRKLAEEEYSKDAFCRKVFSVFER